MQGGFDVANALIDLLYAYVLVRPPPLRAASIAGDSGAPVGDQGDQRPGGERPPSTTVPAA